MRFAVTLSEPSSSTVTVDYQTVDGTATSEQDYEATSGTLTFEPGDTRHIVPVPVVDDLVDDDGETFTLALSRPSGPSGLRLADARGTGTILNWGDNAEDPEGAAAFEDLPASHDGTAFTFRVRFSEAVSTGAEAMRDHAFAVTNGAVSGAQRAEGAGDLWEITVQPDSNDAVTVLLPPTTDCADQGAICTEGGETLSVWLEVLIPGPGAQPGSGQDAATGAPTINGTAQVGETLTVSTSGIADADGLENASFSYQWVRSGGGNDTEIQGATNPTYELQADDLAKTVRVEVSFTDDGGNQETLTSAATAEVAARPNSPATGQPTIGGTAQVGWTLTAGTAGIADTDGLTSVSYGYQWMAGGTDIPGATNSTYVLADSDEGKAVRVKVSFTDDAGNEESLTSEATAAVAARSGNREEPLWSADMLVVAYTEVSIGANSADLFSNVGGSAGLQARSLWSYTPGRELYLAFTGPVPSADDLTLQVGDLTLAFPAGGSGDTDFTWRDVDVDWEDGQTLAARIVLTSTLVDSTPNNPATGLPTISGTAQVGETLTATTSGIADEDGLTSVSYSYQWVSNDGSEDTDTRDATASTHTLGTADQGRTVKVRVSFTDDGGNDETLTSEATAQVAARPNNPATGAPTISGTAQVGQTLTASATGIADADGLSDAIFSYQWVSKDGSTDTEIAEASGSSYALGAADLGKSVKVRVDFTDDGGHQESLTSQPVGPVDHQVSPQQTNSPATGGPAITGTARVGETLTASTSGIVDNDGLADAAFTYQWIRNDSNDYTDIQDATGQTYTLDASDQGKTVRVRVSYTDDAGNQESLTSEATAAVAPRPNTQATGAPSIGGTAQVGETLTASTSGIADTDGLDNATFSYQWLAGNANQGATNSTYTLTDSDKGKPINVQVSFTDDAGNEESLTSQATGAVAAVPVPLTVSLENDPASHNGTDAFTFEIRFSEEFQLSYKTLKFHAFTVTGGTVTKAQRVNKSSNIHWLIALQPDSNADVGVVLPATTNCGATGAICTEDGRKLSSSLELTVSGPGG